MPGRFSSLRRSTKSKRPALTSSSRKLPTTYKPSSKSRPSSSHGTGLLGGLLRPPTVGGGPAQRSRSHEASRRPRYPPSSSHRDSHYGRPKRRETRWRSVSPRARPAPTRGTDRVLRRRRNRESDISADDDSRPVSRRQSPSPPRYRSERFPRPERQRPPGHDTPPWPSSPRMPTSARPPMRSYPTDSYRPDERRRPSHEAPRSPRYPPGGMKQSLPPGYRPAPHLQAEMPRGRPRSRDRSPPPRRHEAGHRGDHETRSSPAKAQAAAGKPSARTPDRTSSKPNEKPAQTQNANKSFEFLQHLPQALATYAGVKSLSSHADSAKEWADWFVNIQNAPEEMHALSAKATTARDTIAQIQSTLAARPDLVEGDGAISLRQQIESAIKSAIKALDKMTELLQDLSSDGTEGKVWSGLQEFYNSYKYKNEWEAKIKEADEDLEKQLGALSTLMAPQSPPQAPAQAAQQTSALATEPSKDEPKSEKAPQPQDQENAPAAAPATPEQPAPVDDPEDALLDAAWSGDLSACGEALRFASPLTRDLQGLTPLHLAAERDHLAIAMLLLDRGADSNARANGGRTPIHLAARFASAAMVEFLVDDGRADVNARTTDGRTPLHYAASAAEDGDDERREVVRILRDWRADPTVEDNKGRTARDLAQKRDYWDVSSTLRRAEKRWEEEHHPNWLQRHGFLK
ncbi:hypothetical protein ACJZ2D_015946 [Fusarium nematophilum]